MAVLKRTRWLRMLLALVMVVSVPAGIAGLEAASDDCVIDCGGGCYIFVDNCPGCTESPGECTIYWGNGDCGDRFHCAGTCTFCEVFEN